VSGYLGLSSYRELMPNIAQARKTASVRVPVLVRLPSSKIQPITGGVANASGEVTPGIGGGLWSISVAEAFFYRPSDTLQTPAAVEFANLFAPFWTARLVPPSSVDRSVALMMAETKDLR
jgi:hypothetical protein